MVLVIIFYGSTTKTRHAYLSLLPAVKTSQPRRSDIYLILKNKVLKNAWDSTPNLYTYHRPTMHKDTQILIFVVFADL